MQYVGTVMILQKTEQETDHVTPAGCSLKPTRRPPHDVRLPAGAARTVQELFMSRPDPGGVFSPSLAERVWYDVVRTWRCCATHQSACVRQSLDVAAAPRTLPADVSLFFDAVATLWTWNLESVLLHQRETFAKLCLPRGLRGAAHQ